MIYVFAKSKLSDIPVVCYCRLDNNIKPGRIFGPVIRDVFICESCTGGYGSVTVNGNEFPVKAGDFYFLFPGDTVVHKSSSEPRRGIYCAFDGLNIGAILNNSGISSAQPFAPSGVFRELTGYLSKIYDMKDEKDPGADLRRAGFIYSILGTIQKSSANLTDKNILINKAIGFMETNYHNGISVDDIAREIGFTRSYFSVMFKKETGISPHGYLSSLRIRKACALFEKKCYSVSDVASLVGLDPTNFSRLFKKETGSTPKKYLTGI